MGATEAYVGVYEYEILKIDFAPSSDIGCQSYGKRFESEYEVIISAQILALCAPLSGVLGLITLLFDACVGKFYACFLVSTLFFLVSLHQSKRQKCTRLQNFEHGSSDFSHLIFLLILVLVFF